MLDKKFCLRVGTVLLAALILNPRLGSCRPSSLQQKEKKTLQDNPNPKGSGELTGGIITTSVGGGVGLGILLINALTYCAPDKIGESKHDACMKRKRQINYVGAGLVLIGAGIGTPMIVSGTRQYRKWKKWNKDHVDGYAFVPSVERLEPSLGQGASLAFRWSLFKYYF